MTTVTTEKGERVGSTPFCVGDWVRVREGQGVSEILEPGDLLRVERGEAEAWVSPDGRERHLLDLVDSDGARYGGWLASRFKPAFPAGAKVRVVKPSYSFDGVGDVGTLTGETWGDKHPVLGVAFERHGADEDGSGWAYYLEDEVELLDDESEPVAEDRDGDEYEVKYGALWADYDGLVEEWGRAELVLYAPIRVLNPELLGEFRDPLERLSNEAIEELRARLRGDFDSDPTPAFKPGDKVRVLHDPEHRSGGDPSLDGHALFLDRPFVPGETARIVEAEWQGYDLDDLWVRFDADGAKRWVTSAQIELVEPFKVGDPESVRIDWDTPDLPALVGVETLHTLPNGTVARYVYTHGDLATPLYKIDGKWICRGGGEASQLLTYKNTHFLVVYLPD